MSIYTDTILKAATEAGLDAAKAEALAPDELAALAGLDPMKPPPDFDAKAEAAFLAEYLKPPEIVKETVSDLDGEVEILVKHDFLGWFTIRTADHRNFPRIVPPETRARIIEFAHAMRLAEDARQRFEGTHPAPSVDLPTADDLAQLTPKQLAEFKALVEKV
jgi:hypothetical protein